MMGLRGICSKGANAVENLISLVEDKEPPLIIKPKIQESFVVEFKIRLNDQEVAQIVLRIVLLVA